MGEERRVFLAAVGSDRGSRTAVRERKMGAAGQRRSQTKIRRKESQTKKGGRKEKSDEQRRNTQRSKRNPAPMPSGKPSKRKKREDNDRKLLRYRKTGGRNRWERAGGFESSSVNQMETKKKDGIGRLRGTHKHTRREKGTAVEGKKRIEMSGS